MHVGVGCFLIAFGVGLAALIFGLRRAPDTSSRFSFLRTPGSKPEDYASMNAKLAKAWPAVFVLCAAGIVVLVVG